MSKYIDKDELWERLQDRMVHHVVTNTLFNTIKAVIDGMPTIEVSEGNDCMLTMFGECSYNETGCGSCAVAEKIRKALKVGEWHRVSADKYVQHAYHFYRCSECGEENIGEPNYCPNCGAKMKGVE